MKKSVLNRIITMTLCTLMLISSMSVAAFAVADSKTTFECRFDGVEDGTLHGSGSKLGWTGFNSSNLGITASDEENGSYLNIRNAGFRNFNIASETLSGGKVYISFSYKYAVPAGMSGGSGMKIYAQSKVNASCVKILSSQYTETEGGPTKVEQCNKENFYIGMVSNKFSIKNDTAATGSTETISAVIDDGEWHEIGYIIDLDSGTLKAVVDGTFSDEYSFPKEYEGTLGTIGFQSDESKYFGSFDNFVVKHIPTENKMTAKVVEDEKNKTIDVSFDEPVAPSVIEALNGGGVTMYLCGAGEGIAVEAAQRTNGAIRLTYSEDLEPGREYFVDFPDNLTSIFGTPLPDGVFVSAEPGDSELVVIEKNIIENCGFEDTDTIKDTWVKTNLTVMDNPTVTDINSSDKVLQASGWIAKLGDNTTLQSSELKGVTTFEMDYIAKGDFFVFYASDTGYMLTNTNGEWKHLKVEVDYAENEMRIYVDGTFKKTYTSSNTAFPDLDAVNYQTIWFGGNNLSSKAGLHIDNFSQTYNHTYTISSPYVKRVRYIDVDDNAIGIDNVTPGIKAITIEFSDAMDEESLADITLSPDSVTGTDYDDDTYTYTLYCDSLLEEESGYILTIPETVKNVSPEPTPVAETIYYFYTIEGEFDIRNVALNKNDTEITSGDIASLAGSSVSVSAEIINTNNTYGDITLKYAFYDDDALVDVNYTTFSIPFGKEIVTTETFNAREGITPDSVKVFVWEGLISDLTPLTTAIEY